jgi:NitT/TauT family transport system substrate-binding protein
MLHRSARRTTLAVAAIAAAAALALTGCSTAASPSGSTDSAAPADLIKVNFGLGYTPGAWDMGEYAAQQLGYFKDAGLDVTITPTAGSAAGVQLLEAGSLDIGKVAMPNVMESDASGGTEVMVASWLQSSGAGIIAKPTIKTLQDLQNTTVVGSAYDYAYQLLPAFEAKAGITLKTNTVDASLIPGGIISGQADALTDSGWGGLPEVQVANVPYTWFPFSDYGADPIGPGYVTTQAYLDKNKDVVQKFVTAALKGWQYVYDNPDAAAKLLVNVIPAMDEPTLLATAKVTPNYAHTDASKTLPLGEIAPDDVTRTSDLLQSVGLIKQAADPSKVFQDIFK